MECRLCGLGYSSAGIKRAPFGSKQFTDILLTLCPTCRSRYDQWFWRKYRHNDSVNHSVETIVEWLATVVEIAASRAGRGEPIKMCQAGKGCGYYAVREVGGVWLCKKHADIADKRPVQVRLGGKEGTPIERAVSFLLEGMIQK